MSGIDAKGLQEYNNQYIFENQVEENKTKLIVAGTLNKEVEELTIDDVIMFAEMVLTQQNEYYSFAKRESEVVEKVRFMDENELLTNDDKTYICDTMYNARIETVLGD